MIDVDGSAIDVFCLPVEEAALAALLRDLFENHWREITFGPIIQGAASARSWRHSTRIRLMAISTQSNSQ
jgi:hypothetical protein